MQTTRPWRTSRLRPRRLILWECPICKERYRSQEDCQICIDRGFSHVVQVGDIVLLGHDNPIYQYGWMDGDTDWVYDKEENDGMPDGCKYAFYYVVTEIDHDPQDPHRPRIHLCTKALAKQGDGFTYYDSSTPKEERHHMVAIPVGDPPNVVVEGSKDLIGTKTEVLI